ncbi:polyprenyl synthetase family protein [Ramlibacter tataouinensis]|uniref:Farnesyltranstransferase (Geranylgeranyl-diphosphate synthase)-like protein n=1 Tax=Ramlibacter tataouinensis (strain ATCC BAA-407 / DSM 14655 / LMG 21543 / TTB310) TaxID=365046 RepID=F5XXQ2_RAMTT|nr:polyprenyl synthetase family protein [Ramlibacter tataouinensis]AEG91855.1 Farnesyltranstransferase (Geranylgeranyl-diphosphate synthase)-like protein [Ramlibacter tataouinensis TTB310]
MSSSAVPTVTLQTLLAWRASVDARLAQLLPPGADGLGAAMRDAALAPGKRLRPLLMLAAGRALAGRGEAVLDLACAVEMVHAASLVLDDMPCMDDARLRRGRPAVHVRHGQDVAMLAAVALLTQAYGAVAAAPGLDGAVRAQLVGVLCDAVGARGLVRGQYRDLREGAAARSLQDIAETNEQKTGVLFAAALEMAALAAGAPDAVAALRAAAGEIGQAFQLRDDLEDGAAGTAVPLKDRHKDVGKSTMVALLGRPAVQQRMDAHLRRAEGLLRSGLRGDETLCVLLRQAFGSAPPAVSAKTPAPRRRAPAPDLVAAAVAAGAGGAEGHASAS